MTLAPEVPTLFGKRMMPDKEARLRVRGFLGL
jgi:hypothetical protein